MTAVFILFGVVIIAAALYFCLMPGPPDDSAGPYDSEN